MVDLHFHAVDARLGIEHLLGNFQVVIGHRLDGLAQLVLDQPPISMTMLEM